MRVGADLFSLELPETYWQHPETYGLGDGKDCVWISDAHGCMVRVKTLWFSGGDRELDDCLREIVSINARSAQELASVSVPFDVELTDHGRLRLAAGFYDVSSATTDAVVRMGMLYGAAGAACDKTFQPGQRRPIAIINVFQYKRPNDVQPTSEEFASFVGEILFSMKLGPSDNAREQPRASEQLDSGRIFPYLVPASYLKEAPPGSSAREIGHGICLALAEDLDGAVKLYFPDEERLPAPFDDLFAQACANLKAALQARKITIHGLEDPSAIRFGYEWLASSCLFLPGLHSFAAQQLGDGPLRACAPHRDALFIFREEDSESILRLLRENESAGPKPLSFGLFALTASGISPV